MAKIIDGEVIGKLGNVIRYKSNNKFYLRKAPHRTKPYSEGELKNQFIFGLVQEWANPLKEVFRVGFKGYNEKMEGVNAGVSLIHREALHRDGYDSYVNPELLKISFGTLGLPAEIQAELQDGELHFIWDTSIDEQKDPKDRVLLVAFNQEAPQVTYDLSGPQRFVGHASLPMLNAAPGTYYVYVAFLAANGKRQSMSRYLGAIIIPP